MHEKIPCTKCKKETEKMDLFPDDVCIDCYRKSKQALREYSQALWGEIIKK